MIFSVKVKTPSGDCWVSVMEHDFRRILQCYEYLEETNDSEEDRYYYRYSKLYRFNGELVASTSEFGE